MLKHLYSNYYLSFKEDQDGKHLNNVGNDHIELQPNISETCYFEIIPQRSFEHKGDSITTNSSFAILHSLTKSYLGSNIFEIDPYRNRTRI